MKTFLMGVLTGFFLLMSFSCGKTEVVHLSESSLANAAYVQHTPSGEADREYIFSEDTLRICAITHKKPSKLTDDQNQNTISAVYQNIKVMETAEKIVVTGDYNLKIEFTKNSEEELENEEGKILTKITDGLKDVQK